jgi:hypothetical protein
MFTNQTSRQITEMTFASESPKSSNFLFNGVFSSSSSVADILLWIAPIAVLLPVRTTKAIAAPLTTVVPEKSIFVISCLTADSSLTTSSVLPTLIDSPVSMAWSTRNEDEENDRIRQSAGIRSPTWIEMISPGTSWDAGIRDSWDERRTSASSGEYSRRA